MALGRNGDALKKVAAAAGCDTMVADLTRVGDLHRVVPDVLARHGRLDVLVNNAGIGWAGSTIDLSPDTATRLVALNLETPIQLALAALPGMLTRRWGHIVNVASIVAFTGRADEAVYAATKAGLAGFTNSLRQELRGSGVSTSLVVPGVIDTPFFERRGSRYTRRWPKPIPPERVADAIVSAVLRQQGQVFVPAWMRLPARFAGAAPGLYTSLASRFG